MLLKTVNTDLLEMLQQAAILTELDGSIVYWNKAAEVLYGWQKDEVIGKNIVGVTPILDLTKEATTIMESVGQGEWFDGQFKVRNKLEEEFTVYVSNFPLVADGVVVGILGISSVYESPKTQEDRSYLLAFISENIPNIVLFRVESSISGVLRLLYISKSASYVLGYDAQVLLHQPDVLLQHLSQEDRQKLSQKVRESIQSMQTLDAVVSYSGENQETKYLKIYAKPYYTLNDSVIWDGMCQNVTEDIFKDKRMKRMAEASERFVSAVAHDLRSPLNTIKGLTTLLASNQNLTEADNIYIEGISSSIKKAEFIINDLLEIASMEDDSFALETKTLCITTSLATLVSHFASLAEQQQKKFDIQLPPVASMFIQAQEDKLLRMVENVLSNAFKFTRKGDRVSLVCTAQQGTACIEVADTGIGIPESLLHVLFDRFTKAKRVGLQGEKPIGLGMSIVKQIAEMHQWNISVKSNEGTGTVFRIQFVPVENVTTATS
jgi:PAS domain S-box-containing protein